MSSTPEERAANEEALRRVILTLWQTRILRELRLTVRDEIENGLSYYRYTFLRQLPRLYGEIEDLLARKLAGSRDRRARRSCAWALDRRRPRRQPLRHPRRDAPRAGAPVVHRAGFLPGARSTSSAASCRSPCAW